MPPAVKKRKTTRATNASKTSTTTRSNNARPAPLTVKVGGLTTLLEMPVDIMYEVCSHLRAPDILHLAHTSKILHGLLMSKSWSSAWRNVIKNDLASFPPKPDDINEPQYIALICADFCGSCGKEVPSSTMSLWSFRKRRCESCIKISSDLCFSDVLQTTCMTYFQPVLRKSEIDDVCSALEGCPDPEAVARYIKQRTKVVEAANKFRDACNVASAERIRNILLEAEVARRVRKENIVRRLRVYGYSDELEYLQAKDPTRFDLHSDVYSEVPMTDEIFADILPRLTPLMLATREKAARRKQRKLHDTRLKLLAGSLAKYASENTTKPCPHIADLAFIPTVKAMLADKDTTANHNEETFAKFEAELPKICKEWRRTKNKALASLMPPTMTLPHLALAVSIFQCVECSQPVAYPQILGHSCLRVLRTGYRNREEDVVDLLEALREEPWNFAPRNGVQWHHYAVACAVDVVRACGLAAETATPEDMDAAPVQWLECMDCRDTKKKKSFVCQWRNAIVHGLYHLSRKQPATWNTVTSQCDVDAAEDEHEKRTTRPSVTSHVCTRCEVKVERCLRAEHLRLVHDIEQTDNISREFTRALDVPLSELPYNVQIPLTTKRVAHVDLTRTGSDSNLQRSSSSASVVIIDD